MVRLVKKVKKIKKPTKRIRTLCKKYHVKLTLKKGKKRVPKKLSVIKKQLRRKMKSKRKSRFGSSCGSNITQGDKFGKIPAGMGFGKRRRRKTRFGDCGCNKPKEPQMSFGKRKYTASVRKLHKLCKVYKVKIGRKSPEILRKQCLKKAMGMLRSMKKSKPKRRTRFGFNPLSLGSSLAGAAGRLSNQAVHKVQEAAEKTKEKADKAQKKLEEKLATVGKFGKMYYY